jgi:calcineurin-like phosphoesterase family protein
MSIFFCSDHHLYHKNILKFTRDDGTPLRVFDDVDHMHEHIIQQHNRVVGPDDKVYFLGDVTMSQNLKGLEILRRFNGHKILIRGNHDECKLSQYAEFFEDVRGVTHRYGLVMTHVPIHPDSLERWGFNLHGHLHYRQVLLPNGHPDPRYINVSLECLDDYTPISLDEINKRMSNATKHMAVAKK